MPSSAPPEHACDRYAARPLIAGRWQVWDRLRKEPVFGGETLLESQAQALAQRLSQAYHRARTSLRNDPDGVVTSKDAVD
jgi:hypothetical protein